MKKLKDKQKTIITKHIMPLGYNGLTKLPNNLVPSLAQLPIFTLVLVKHVLGIAQDHT
jgi:hypothetical protein